MSELHLPQPAGTPRGATETPVVHHETTDVNFRAILAFGGGMIIVGAGISFLVWLLFGYFASREAQRVPAEYPLAISQGERVPPEPRLQTAPREDLRDLRASEDAVLDNYGWVDKKAGIVRIPIDEAIRLTLERGLPTRQEGK
jgi:hypothetical protein